MKVLITGAAGNAGQAVARQVAKAGHDVRLADVVTPPPDIESLGEVVRCDTRMPADALTAV